MAASVGFLTLDNAAKRQWRMTRTIMCLKMMCLGVGICDFRDLKERSLAAVPRQRHYH